MNALSRLLWALPLVLATGVAAMLLLRRFVVPMQTRSRDARRLSLRESLAVSDDTRLHLVEIDQQPYVIVESARGAVLQAMPAAAVDAQRSAARLTPRWLRRLRQVRSP
jgi:flagellar biogenesis protein FliO